MFTKMKSTLQNFQNVFNKLFLNYYFSFEIQENFRIPILEVSEKKSYSRVPIFFFGEIILKRQDIFIGLPPGTYITIVFLRIKITQCYYLLN